MRFNDRHRNGSHSSQAAARPEQPFASDMITMRLKDLCPLLVEASLQERAFLGDFAEDCVHVTRDVYEVLVAYRRCVLDGAA
ncbi:MAG: hypothetical protein U0905_22855 [Pirellulales bacterium]